VRQGDGVAKDMIAVRIGPDMRFVVVGAPAYLAKRAPPKSPQDLAQHDCIMLRLPTRGGLYAWELRKGKREVRARVEGRLVFNGVFQTLKAAVGGFGLAFVPEDIAHPYIAEGKLKIVLEPWCPTFDGLHIYYPNRRQASRAMELLIEELRYRA
jgi:DNA-binding transcriptional LysR family regulator